MAWVGFAAWWMISRQAIAWVPMVITGLGLGLILRPDLRPRTLARVVRDWSLVAAWLMFYYGSRGAAETVGMPLQEGIWIDIDRVIGFGELPTHRLQALIDWDAPPRLWEASLSVMYLSHFFVGFGVLLVMYNRDRLAWGRWYRRVVAMGAIGIIGYILLPSAPPWWSSDAGTIAEVHAGLPRGWDAVQIEWIHELFEFGRDHVNPVAAMPSLHAAFPVLLYLFWAPRGGRIRKLVLGSYALYMVFTIVITGQHWVIDAVAGWLVAYVAHRIVSHFEARSAARAALVAAYTDRSTAVDPMAPSGATRSAVG